jgi:hypothetical protein
MNPHFDWTHIFTAVGGIIAAYLGKGAVRYGMGQMRSRISSSVGRSNMHDANAMSAESLVLQSAQMHIEETKEVRKQLDTVNEQRIKEALERGRMIGKVEILEKQQFPSDPLSSAFDGLGDIIPIADEVLPEKPLESGENGIEILPKSQRKKHILTENSDEFANTDWTIQPLGNGGKNARNRTSGDASR